MKLYAVLFLQESIEIKDNMGRKADMAVTWHDGMIGALPVFSSLEDLRKVYPNQNVVELEFPDRVVN